jgi:hypothetical protein
MAKEKSVLLAAQSEAKTVALQIQIGSMAGTRYHGYWFQKNRDMKKRTHRAAVYRRKSGGQPDDSIRAQLKVIRRYARQRGMKIVKVATDGVA